MTGGRVVILFLTIMVLFSLAAFTNNTPKAYSIEDIARYIIYNSNLQKEQLDDGTTNNVTRCRDYVNAYRSQHELLGSNGWYNGISEAHNPILEILVDAIEAEGYIPDDYNKRIEQVLKKFFKASDDTNAQELGYTDIKALLDDVKELRKGDDKDKEDAKKIKDDLDKKWK